MATAAFKSTSRRGNISSENSNSPKKVPSRRRSLSVSAVSRTQQDVPSEFLNRRDNPLFWGTGSPPDKDIESENTGGVAKFTENASKVGGLASKAASTGQRGRSVTRNLEVGSKKEIGRSLSRVDTGRNRSASRGRYGASETEVEQESVLSSKYPNRSNLNLAINGVRKFNSATKMAELPAQLKSSRSSQHLATECLDDSTTSLQVLNWEDGVSTGSLSEAEEKTIKAVCEQMKSFREDQLGGDSATSGIYETVRSEVRRAISDIQNDLESAIRRNNSTAIATTNVADIPTDLVNPGAVELILDIRREYARKLEESQERARKLRADLAVEEHRGQELSRILRETLPDPKSSTLQRSRFGRKNSSERKKMSKRLTEEAMAYFDECVSISTFDSSDFSASEDPPLNSVGASIPVGGTACHHQGSRSSSMPYCPNSCLNHKQESGGHAQLLHTREDSGLTAFSSSNETSVDQVTLGGINSELNHKVWFSFVSRQTDAVGIQQDIRNYIKHFEKGINKESNNSQIIRSSYYDKDESNIQGRAESLLFDRVFFNSRIESGGLHLCGGVIEVPFSPFASVT